MTIAPEDRKAFSEFAYRLGYRDPDSPSPYRKGSESHLAWIRGREARLHVTREVAGLQSRLWGAERGQ